MLERRSNLRSKCGFIQLVVLCFLPTYRCCYCDCSDIKIAAFDATTDGAIADRFGVKGYPTIKYFPKGETKNPEDYTGGRIAGDIVQ